MVRHAWRFHTRDRHCSVVGAWKDKTARQKIIHAVSNEGGKAIIDLAKSGFSVIEAAKRRSVQIIEDWPKKGGEGDIGVKGVYDLRAIVTRCEHGHATQITGREFAM